MRIPYQEHSSDDREARDPVAQLEFGESSPVSRLVSNSSWMDETGLVPELNANGQLVALP